MSEAASVAGKAGSLWGKVRPWLLAEPASERRFPGLDALRGILALAVAAYHLSVWTELYPSGSFGNMSLSKLGNFSVSAFFLLSGFLAFRLQDWEKLRREGFGRYYLKRYLRLAPLFYLAITLNLAFGLGMGPQPSWRMVAENFTLCFGAIHPNHAFIAGGWYVGLAALFFAAYPILAWGRVRGSWIFLLGLALALWLWSLPYSLHLIPAATQYEKFHLYVQPGNQLFLLAAGGLLAELHGRVRARLAVPALVALAALLLALLLWPEPRFCDHLAVLTGWIRYWYLLLAAGVVLIFALQGWAPGRLGRALAALGAWSYGIYLLHPILERLVILKLHGASAFWASLALSILAAALAERWIERPLARLASR